MVTSFKILAYVLVQVRLMFLHVRVFLEGFLLLIVISKVRDSDRLKTLIRVIALILSIFLLT